MAKKIQVLRALDSLGSGQTKERQPSLSLPSEPSVQFGPAQVSSGKRRGRAEGEGEQAGALTMRPDLLVVACMSVDLCVHQVCLCAQEAESVRVPRHI